MLLVCWPNLLKCIDKFIVETHHSMDILKADEVTVECFFFSLCSFCLLIMH